MPRMNAPSGGSGGNAGFQVYFDVLPGNADEMIAKLEMMLGPAMLGTFLAGPVVEHFQDKFTRYFETESSASGAWVPLSEVTIRDRVEQGFGPGPINDRTGELRGFVTESPGNVRVLETLAVLTFPGPVPTGELGRKVKTAQAGGTFQGHDVPARPVIDADESDLLYIMSALSFFIEAGV